MKGTAPVLTLDGPGGAGKGTISRLVAERLGWHLLDSGALYRLTALAAMRHGVALNDEAALERVAAGLDVVFVAEAESTRVLLEGDDVSREIRTEQVGDAASRVAALNGVRQGLLQRQRDFRQAPAWWPTVVTWAPWCSLKPNSRCSSPPAPRNGRAGATSSCSRRGWMLVYRVF